MPRCAIAEDSEKTLLFDCPGCESGHGIPTTGPRAWQWNGSLDLPTISPSILVRYPANLEAIDEFAEWRKERICHSFVSEGRIEFLADCTHKLAGQTVDLPEF